MIRCRLVLMALPLIVLGCGGDDDDGDLVRYEIEAGELNFEFGEPQDSVVPIPDALLIVQPDGEATYEFTDQPEIAFRLDDAALSKLESGLDAIDFEEADAELSGETEEGLPALSVTHDGTTVDLGDKFIDINYGEGPAVADQMGDLLDELDGLIGKAPGVEKAVDEYLGTRDDVDLIVRRIKGEADDHDHDRLASTLPERYLLGAAGGGRRSRARATRWLRRW